MTEKYVYWTAWVTTAPRGSIQIAADLWQMTAVQAALRGVSQVTWDASVTAALRSGALTEKSPSVISMQKSRPSAFSEIHAVVVGARMPSPQLILDHPDLIEARKWSAGETLLVNTINSLAAAGWDRVCVLAEPHSPRPRSDRIPGTTMLWALNNATAGPWRNFVNTLRIAVRNEPLSERILLCQDDIVITSGLRRHLDREPSFAGCLADPQFGVASLYCAAVNRSLAPGDGWFCFPSRLNSSAPQGALAYVFTRASAESLLATVSHLPTTQDCVERKVARWCQLTGRHYLAHRPSFVQHMGHGLSTIRPGDDSDLASSRRASDFVAAITCEGVACSQSTSAG